MRESERDQKEEQHDEPFERPTAEIIPFNRDYTNIDEYNKVAQDIEFEPIALLRENLMRFLEKEKIPYYDYEKVMDYLRGVCPKGKRMWWKPLTNNDKPIEAWPPWTNTVYDKLVPLEMLKRVAKIESAFPKKFRFCVSDFAVPESDPFIVAHKGRVHVVFGVWDEPGFED